MFRSHEIFILNLPVYVLVRAMRILRLYNFNTPSLNYANNITCRLCTMKRFIMCNVWSLLASSRKDWDSCILNLKS